MPPQEKHRAPVIRAWTSFANVATAGTRSPAAPIGPAFPQGLHQSLLITPVTFPTITGSRAKIGCMSSFSG